MKSRHDRHETTMERIYAHIESRVRAHVPPKGFLLDVGSNTGERTVQYRGNLDIGLHIYDWRDNRGDVARQHTSFDVVDLETDTFPHADGTFDVVVCNQVFEHLKNIFQPLSEIHRVLKTGGHLIFSVPNLAAAHNRLLMALGRQPSTIRVVGSHVRGFTLHEAALFLSQNGLFAVEECAGFGLHPFTSARLPGPLRGLCHTPVWLCRKTAGGGPTWREARNATPTTTKF